MASPFMSAFRSPHCLSCIRRIETSLGEGLRGPSLQQVRGKKKMPKVSTIPVKLLQDVPRYGKQGTVIAVAPGRMRNEWYPKGMASYMTVAQLKEEGLVGKVLERDSKFGLNRNKSQELQDAATRKVEEARAALDALTMTPERSTEVLSGLLPMRLIFHRAPVVAPPPPPTRHSPSIPSFANVSEEVAKAETTESEAKTAIYGSVTTVDIAGNIMGVLSTSQEGQRVVLGPEDIKFVEEGEEGDRVKHLGSYSIEIQVKGADMPIRRTIEIVPQEQ